MRQPKDTTTVNDIQTQRGLTHLELNGVSTHKPPNGFLWQLLTSIQWCPESDSNRQAFRGRQILSLLRIPISPSGQDVKKEVT